MVNTDMYGNPLSVEDTTGSEALSYFGSNVIYVVVFILLTLVMTWTVGDRLTFWFLALVILGQLVTNVAEVQALLPGKAKG